MKSRAFSTRFNRLGLAAVLMLACLPQAFGSGGSICDDLACYSFFAPEIIGDSLASPFFRSNQSFYRRLYARPAGEVEVDDVNLDEWMKYYGPVVSREQLSALIYKMSVTDVESLIAALINVGPTQSQQKYDTAFYAAFAKYGRRDFVIRSLQYMALAKMVEPVALSRVDDGWPPNRTPAIAIEPRAVQNLIDTAEQQIPRVDSFLEQRYRFQVMRVLYYSDQFDEAQDYFERYKNRFSGETSPKYRFMSYAAGAYYKNLQYGKANYLFSIVFDKFGPLKKTAYSSFHPMEEPDWNETLSLAKTSHEKEVLWQLLGIYADGMAAIDRIYAINPKSKLLPLLLVRQVNEAEASWTSNRDRLRYGGPDNRPVPDPQAVGDRRLDQIRMIADRRNTYKPYLWSLSAAHLYALAGDSTRAEQYARDAMKSMPDDPDVRAQARMTFLFARVRAIKSIDKSVEPFLAQELAWLRGYMSDENYRARNLNTWLLEYLSSVYRKDGDELRALLINDSPESAFYLSTANIDSMLEFMKQPKGAFDQFLVHKNDYTPGQFEELKAIDFLYAEDLTRAADAFRRAGSDIATQQLRADPFMGHINDCHDCDVRTPHTAYTKLSFTERMLLLSTRAQGQGQPAADASFELANGFYNMSYYGNSRDIFGTSHNNHRPPEWNDRGAEFIHNMDRSEKYYLRSADLSTNKEFKARALFMAAKADQNRRYRINPKDGNAANPSRYFKTLKDSYSDTQYYQEIIRECGYFRDYARR